MRLDLTITLGNLLTIGAIVAGGFLSYQKLKERLITIETQLSPLWAEYNERRREQRRAEDRG